MSGRSAAVQVTPGRPGFARRMGLLPLVAATYFIVAGGPYGLEELVQKAGYSRTLLILLITPLIWSLPTALMVGELSSALPEEGGFYVWVRRAIGPFWGFQEAWLSLASSVFDMAIYPTIFVLYLVQLFPQLNGPHAVSIYGSVMIALCTGWNLPGSRAVSRGSVVLMGLLLAPFAVLVALSLRHASVPLPAHASQAGLFAGILIAMWNFMGWDNASTIAGEVERPQHTYPLAMLMSVALVAATYIVVVAACAHAGLDPGAWTTGSWSEAGAALGGRPLGWAISLGGIVCGLGMFNVLMMSNTRLPFAMAEDRLLPAALARRSARNDAPWVAIVVCALAWMACLGLGFERLVQLDVLLNGLSLLLEFVALVVLRIREPRLPRPFRVPGGIAGAALVGVGPLVLLALAALQGGGGQTGRVHPFALGATLVAAGPLLYLVFARRFFRNAGTANP